MTNETPMSTFEEIFEQRIQPNQHPLHGRTLIEIEREARMEMQRRLYLLFAPPPNGEGIELNKSNVRKVIRWLGMRYRLKDLPLPPDLNLFSQPEKLIRITEELIKRAPEEVDGVVEWFPMRGVKVKEHRTHAEFLKQRREKRRAKKEKERGDADAHAVRESMKAERGE